METGKSIFNADNFRKLMSENLGVDFSHRESIINKMRNLLCNINGHAKHPVGDDQLFDALTKTLDTIGFTIDLESITPQGNDCTSLTATKGEEKLNIGITNTIDPYFYLIITVIEP